MQFFGTLSCALAVIVLSVAPAAAVLQFARPTLLIVNAAPNAGPQAMTLVDINKDNRADILVVDHDNNLVKVFLNDGNGGFPGAPSSTADMARGPVAVATGDFNKDGNLDVVSVNSVASNVTVRLGDGAGNFNTPRDFTVDTNPAGVAVGDFNNDGNPDLAVLSSSTIHLLKGNGDGSFTNFPTASVSTGRNNTSGGTMIVTGLMNGDLFPDLVTSNHDTRNVSVLIGNGDGTFKTPIVKTATDLPRALFVAELNGDAYQDVAVALERTGAATDENVQLLYGNGDGTFSSDVALTTAESEVTAVVVADLDADGQPDMAAPNASGGIGLVLLCNEQGGCFDTGTHANPPESGFQQQIPSSVGNSVAIQAGKMNADAFPDLIVLSADGGVIDILINTTGGAPPSPTTPAGPGTPTATPGVPPTVTAIASTPTPTLTLTAVPTATPTPIPTAPYGVCNSNAPGQPAVGGKPVAVTTGDFYHDGNPAIAVADNQGNKVVLLRTQINSAAPGPCGMLGLTRGTELPNIAAPIALAAADFDHDDKLDLAVVGSAGLSVFFGNGDGTFQDGSANPMAAGTSPNSIAVADFNGDDRPDIIVGNAGSNDVSIFFFNKGQHAFDSPCTVSVGRNATFVVAQDLNGDSRPDFAVTSQQTNDVVVFLQSTSTGTPTVPTCPTASLTFTSLPAVKLPQQPHALAFDNFDQTNPSRPGFAVALSSNVSGTDGNVKVFLASSPTSGGLSYSSAGTLTVTSPTGAQSASFPSALGTGDVNGDGRPDVIVTDQANDTVVIFLATGNGSFATSLIPFAINGQGPVGIAVAKIDGDAIPDIVTANQDDGSVSVLVSSRPPATPTPLPTLTPTITGTPTPTPLATDTATPTPTSTPTATPTWTPLPTLTPVPSPVPTATLKPGTIGLQGSCALDPTAPDDWLWVAFSAAVALGLAWRSRIVLRATDGL